MTFAEMPYQRPDLAALKADYNAITARLRAAASYADARAAFLDNDTLERRITTQSDAGQHPPQHRHPRPPSMTARKSSGTPPTRSCRPAATSSPPRCWKAPSAPTFPPSTAT